MSTSQLCQRKYCIVQGIVFRERCGLLRYHQLRYDHRITRSLRHRALRALASGQHPYLVTGATTQELSSALNGHLGDCQALSRGLTVSISTSETGLCPRDVGGYSRNVALLPDDTAEGWLELMQTRAFQEFISNIFHFLDSSPAHGPRVRETIVPSCNAVAIARPSQAAVFDSVKG